MTIKEKYISDLILDLDMKSGSVKDKTGRNTTAMSTGGYFSQTHKGRMLKGTAIVAATVTNSADVNLFGVETTIVCDFITPIADTGVRYLLHHLIGGAPGAGYLLRLSNGSIEAEVRAVERVVGLGSAGVGFNDGKRHQLVITSDSANHTTKLYVDGVYRSVNSAYITLIDYAAPLNINYSSNNDYGVLSTQYYRTIFTAEDVANLWSETQKEANLSFIPKNTVLPARQDSSSKVLHYPYLQGAKALDISGNARDSAVTNAYSSNDSIFKGSFGLGGANWIETASTINLSAVNQVSVSLWFKPYDTNVSKNLMEFSTNFNSVTDGFTLSTSGGFVTVGYRDGGGYSTTASPAVLVPGAWYHIVGTYDRTQTGGEIVNLYINGEDVGVVALTAGTGGGFFGTHKLYIGSRAGTGSFINGVVEDVRVYSSVLNEENASRFYQEGIARLEYNFTGEDWNVSAANVTSGFIGNSGFIASTGSWKIVDTDTDSKAIKCISAGNLFFPIYSPSFGTFKFDIKSALTTTNTYLAFILQNATNFMRFHMDSAGTIYLKEVIGGVENTLINCGSYTANTWYEIIITRTPQNKYTVYVNRENKGTSTPATVLVDSKTILTQITPAANGEIRSIKFTPTVIEL